MKKIRVLIADDHSIVRIGLTALLETESDSVGQHLTAIFAKLGAANRAEAIAIALRKHLLKI